MKHVKVTTHYGARYGLRLMLSPDLEEYIPAVTPGHGVRVSIHHPRTVPFPEDTGLNVPINSRTSIRVTMNDIARVKEPHGNCTSDDEWNKNYVGAYTSEGCVNVCLERRIRERCHCIRMLNTILTNGDDDDMVRCNPTNSTQDQCVAVVRVNFLQNKEPCVCFNPCSERRYDTSLSFNGDNHNFSDILAPLKEVLIPLDPVKIHVYMESLSASLIKEAPAFTPFTLISNIGGSFGLFVGLSLVTVVEILEFLFDFCVMMVPRTRRAHAVKKGVAPAA
ncbi:degenerin del-1-like [Amphibalanus amphitrite]|uniref:degenerin del-1-like n=1 Tax=Amphibalanus amphitrite TaxID=1232801 RepID=UPI001C90BA3C|nr:degenerin del-1-like [Amphibalanus amphitrite]